MAPIVNNHHMTVLCINHILIIPLPRNIRDDFQMGGGKCHRGYVYIYIYVTGAKYIYIYIYIYTSTALV